MQQLGRQAQRAGRAVPLARPRAPRRGRRMGLCESPHTQWRGPQTECQAAGNTRGITHPPPPPPPSHTCARRARVTAAAGDVCVGGGACCASVVCHSRNHVTSPSTGRQPHRRTHAATMRWLATLCPQAPNATGSAPAAVGQSCECRRARRAGAMARRVGWVGGEGARGGANGPPARLHAHAARWARRRGGAASGQWPV